MTPASGSPEGKTAGDVLGAASLPLQIFGMYLSCGMHALLKSFPCGTQPTQVPSRGACMQQQVVHGASGRTFVTPLTSCSLHQAWDVELQLASA